MNYFDGCKTQEDVKKVFREMAKKLHPDNGGNPEEFKLLRAQYEEAAKRLWNTRATADGKTYNKESKQTPEEYMRIIEALINFEGLTIEIIGTWIWVSGDTYPARERLNELNFIFSKPKRAWYNNGGEKTGKRGHCKNLEEIRSKWGVSFRQETPGREKLV